MMVAQSLWASETVNDRLDRLEKAVDQLDVKLGLLSERSNLMIQKTMIAFPKSTYLIGSLSLLLPRQRSFSYATDMGLGISVGVGHYFDKHHVVQGNLDWDLYPGFSARYRYEWRGSSSNVSFGPVVGVKTRLFAGRPMDNFLDSREDVDKFFGILGGFVSLPVGLSILHTELALFLNKQVVITATVGLQLFL